MAERIAHLTVAIAPELIGDGHRYDRAGRYRAAHPGIGIVDLEMQRDARRFGLGMTAPFGELVAQHQPAVVDPQARLHQPDTVFRDVRLDRGGGERGFVEAQCLTAALFADDEERRDSAGGTIGRASLLR